MHAYSPAVQAASTHGAAKSTFARPTNIAIVLGLIAYQVLFYAQPFPVTQGTPPTRAKVLGTSLILPDRHYMGWTGGDFQPAVWDRLPLAGVGLVLLASFGAAGWAVVRILKMHTFLDGAEQAAFALSIGLALGSLLSLAIGLAGCLQSRLAFGILISGGPCAAALVGWRARVHANTRVAFNELTPAGKGKLPWHYWLAAVPFVMVLWAGGFIPPFEFDVREYHLQSMKEFFQSGRIGFVPHNVYANMPLGAESLALGPMALLQDWWLGAVVGKWLIAWFPLVTAGALFTAGRRFVSAAAGLVAALVYLSIPWILKESTQGLIDAVLAHYLWMAAYAALLVSPASAAPRPNSAREVLACVAASGWFAGAAMACKYPGLLFVAIPVFAAICWWQRRMPVKTGLVFLLSAFLCSGLWFIKNAVLTGNPCYPLLYDWFGGRSRDLALNEKWVAAHRPPAQANGLEYLADLSEQAYRIAVASEWHSPLLIPFAGLAFLAAAQRSLIRWLWAYVVFVFAAWWLFTHRIDRFWLPILPVLALLAGVGFARVVRKGGLAAGDALQAGSMDRPNKGSAPWVGGDSGGSRLLVWVAMGCMGLGLVYNFAAASGPWMYSLYFARLDHMRTDPERVDPWHLYLNDQMHAGEVVLLVGDAQPFDLEHEAIYDTVFDTSWESQWLLEKPASEVRAALKKHRIKYVYVHWAEIARYRAKGNYGFDERVQPAVFEALVQSGVLLPAVNANDLKTQGFLTEAQLGKLRPGELFAVAE